MNQYAYIFTMYEQLQPLSVSVPGKLLCQCLYRSYSVLSDELTVQRKSDLSWKSVLKKETRQTDLKKTSR